ncbi:hypothetical protein G7Y89_g5982 [Cudoniella acicularis]|uniref:Peptidase A1 domain-containing protein n=1 Tax=Cudoniella acicularis TaxID=354080 RepID=A0A8H4RM78_9HELO|nr:hypothetical protein G7Y89_g5982 [Cudoniella acicularis]
MKTSKHAPTQAVSVAIGTPPQNLDLFPGGYFASRIHGSALCPASGACDARNSGLYNPNTSSTVVTTTATGPENVNITFQDNTNIFGVNSSLFFDNLKLLSSDQDVSEEFVPGFDMEIVTAGYNVLPSGRTYPLQVGVLALGTQDANQSWPRVGLPNFNGTYLPSSLFEQGLVPSNSYGLHIGSSSLEIPGSLWIGGYDQTRIVGPVTAQAYGFMSLPIDLLDISIGTAVGNSPFSFPSKSGLLAEGNATIGPFLNVEVNVEVQYMYFPKSTCDAIASNLPVSFRADLGLYIWNTSSPQYETIISSPAFLGFTFRLNDSVSQNLTINVPFALLNLTLTSPIVDTPIQYFPCRPVLDFRVYSLGKAFLQAAFVGVTWQTDNNGVWFLAQAPGPNTPSITGAVVTPIQPSDRFVVPSNNDWIDTWKNTWKPIGTEVVNVNTSNTTSVQSTPQPSQSVSQALSVGAIAGIITAAFASICFLCIGIYFLRKRSVDKNAANKPDESDILHYKEFESHYSSLYNGKNTAGFGPREMDSGLQRTEMEAVDRPGPRPRGTVRARVLERALAVDPMTLQWSSKIYGPDGPWQAVEVGIGTPPQIVDLFPGGIYNSIVYGSALCTTVCDAQVAGLYNSQVSSTAFNNPESPSSTNISFGSSIQGVDMASVFDTLTVTPTGPNAKIASFDMEVWNAGFNVLPGGLKYGLQIGNLALGSPDVNQTWYRTGLPSINGTLLTSSLFAQGLVPSNSFGLHIGSVSLGIPGSLYVGGYDQTRVVGPVTAQAYSLDFSLDMLDISIDTAVGDSPFSFPSKSGLLPEGNSLGSALTVRVDPAAAYLSLPQSACDAITSNLPVIFKPDFGLYLWNTSDPQYQRIISSPAFLGFTFRMNSSVTQNVTINVPFSLLNLTLEPPIVSSPTFYFPCAPSNGTVFTLGRAFLQAAFMGVSWETNRDGVWFLGQAPGPNTPSRAGAVITAIQPTDRFIIPSTNSWIATWNTTWKPIGSNVVNANTTTIPQSNSPSSSPTAAPTLSTGAIAGGTVAGIAVITLIILGVFFFLRRRKRASSVVATAPSGFRLTRVGNNEAGIINDKTAAGFGPREMEGGNTIDGHRLGYPSELESTTTRGAEMDGAGLYNDGRNSAHAAEVDGKGTQRALYTRRFKHYIASLTHAKLLFNLRRRFLSAIVFTRNKRPRRSELLSKLQAPSINIHRHNTPRTYRLTHSRTKQSHGPGTKNNHLTPNTHIRRPGHMNRNRERLNQNPLIKPHALRKLIAETPPDSEILD